MIYLGNHHSNLHSRILLNTKRSKLVKIYEDIEDYPAQDHKMLNTMEATANLCLFPFLIYEKKHEQYKTGLAFLIYF